MPIASIDTKATADCGASRIIKAGESSVLVQTRVEQSSATCAGCLFSLRFNLSPCLNSANIDKHRLCVEDDAPVCR